MDSECPKHYTITGNRQKQLIKLIPLLQPVILDQLSPLIELKQWLCQLSVMEQTATRANPVLLEPIFEIKANILKECDNKWKNIAEKQRAVVFSNDKTFLQDTAQKYIKTFT